MTELLQSTPAYGQTASGKTHTLLGSLDDQEEHGVLPRAFQYCLDRAHEAGASIAAEMVEIHNDVVHDLLSTKKCPIQIRQDGAVAAGGVGRRANGIVLHGATEVAVRDMDEVTEMLAQGIASRKTAGESCAQLSMMQDGIA